MNNLHLPSSSRAAPRRRGTFPSESRVFAYADLNRVRRLMALYDAFRASLRLADVALSERYEHACTKGTEDTELLIDVGRHLDSFIARLFHIEKEVNDLNRRTNEDRSVFEFKKRFLDRLVLKTPLAAQELAAMNIAEVEFRYRERVAEILTRGEWANDPEARIGRGCSRGRWNVRPMPRAAATPPSRPVARTGCAMCRPGRARSLFIRN